MQSLAWVMVLFLRRNPKHVDEDPPRLASFLVFFVLLTCKTFLFFFSLSLISLSICSFQGAVLRSPFLIDLQPGEVWWWA